jgi:hypothetical protein
MYLMIRNPGVADYRGFCLIGASTSRTTEATIGQFGSGSKLSIALLLRNNIRPVIFTGNLKMEFFSKPETMNGQTFNRVCLKFGGKDVDGTSKTTTEEQGFCLEWGEQDWDNVHMAVREFVSNAIDGSIVNGGTYKDVELEIVGAPRAKAGYTSVFLPYTTEVESVYRDLGIAFLHFGHAEHLQEKLLPKLDEDNQVRIYKKGVLAAKFEGPSVFDYNLGNELTLDESRNASEYDVRSAVAEAIAEADPAQIVKLLAHMTSSADVWEAKLHESRLASRYVSEEVHEGRARNWQLAWMAFAGKDGVATSGLSLMNKFVEAKGYRPVSILSNSWLRALGAYGIATEMTVLSRSEQEGKELLPPTSDMIEAVDWSWGLAESFALTNGKRKPEVKMFKEIMKAEAQCRGFYENNCVYLHTDLLSGFLLNKVALEECVHHITGATDNSRDFQDYLLRLITQIAS